MKIPFIHYPKNKDSLINSYFVALIPLLLFGFYKNGLLLYFNDLINISGIFIPVYFYFVSVIIAFIVSLIFKTDKKEHILISLIIASSISINTNMLIYPLLLFVLLFISEFISIKSKLTFNKIALVRIFLILALLINSYSYLNIAEKLDKFNYGLFDIFIGYCSGGIATSSALVLLISFVILSFNKFYKKIIPLTSSLVFIIIGFLYSVLTNNLDFIKVVLNGTVYFTLVFIAPDLYITPNTKKGMFIYGLIIGIVTSVLVILLNMYEAPLIAVLISSIFIPLINRIINRKYLESA